MFNRAYYTLQAKKILWFATMVGLAGFAAVNAFASTWLSPVFMIGMAVGIGVYHLLPLLPQRIRGTGLPLLAPLIAMAMPETIAFCLGYFGLLLYMTVSADNKSDIYKKMDPMGKAQAADLEVLEKLERKTKITCHNKFVSENDAKDIPPNAGAAWLYDGNVIAIQSNMFSSTLTLKERKAIYAHEFGHINHRDSIFHSVTKCLYWTTTAFTYLAFSFPIALLVHFVSSASYFSISQIDELLADQFSARHANPLALSSGFDKLDKLGKEYVARMNEKTPSPSFSVSRLRQAVKYAIGMSTHPTDELRKAYLAEYANEKRIAKCKPC